MKYCVVKEKIVNNEIGSYTAYGIEIRDRGVTLRRISDVFSSYRNAKKLCSCCNRLRLDEEQIDDVIQDYLID